MTDDSAAAAPVDIPERVEAAALRVLVGLVDATEEQLRPYAVDVAAAVLRAASVEVTESGRMRRLAEGDTVTWRNVAVQRDREIEQLRHYIEATLRGLVVDVDGAWAEFQRWTAACRAAGVDVSRETSPPPEG